MASLTIRQMEDDLTTELRLRAAANNSMEEEARRILRNWRVQADAGPSDFGTRIAPDGSTGPAVGSTWSCRTRRPIATLPDVFERDDHRRHQRVVRAHSSPARAKSARGGSTERSGRPADYSDHRGESSDSGIAKLDHGVRRAALADRSRSDPWRLPRSSSPLRRRMLHSCLDERTAPLVARIVANRSVMGRPIQPSRPSPMLHGAELATRNIPRLALDTGVPPHQPLGRLTLYCFAFSAAAAISSKYCGMPQRIDRALDEITAVLSRRSSIRTYAPLVICGAICT